MKTRFPDLFALTPDEIKECYAEYLGFDSLAEKAQIEKQYVWPFYYQALGLYMSLGKRLVVSEYPFSEKQKPLLTFLAQSYGYECLTIRLTASFETLWERRFLRDRADDRHLSFIMERYHYGDVLEDRQAATNHITKEAFRQIITDRRYDDFQLGALIEVNVEVCRGCLTDHGHWEFLRLYDDPNDHRGIPCQAFCRSQTGGTLFAGANT